MQLAVTKTNRIMLLVIASMLPGILVSTWFFGWGVLLNIVLASAFALSFEALALAVQKKPVRKSLQDNSALVTALLFAITVPPGSSWWLLFLGMAFAILLAKHAYEPTQPRCHP